MDGLYPIIRRKRFPLVPPDNGGGQPAEGKGQKVGAVVEGDKPAADGVPSPASSPAVAGALPGLVPPITGGRKEALAEPPSGSSTSQAERPAEDGDLWEKTGGNGPAQHGKKRK